MTFSKQSCPQTSMSAQVNAGSIAPITAVQFGANRFYEITLKSITGKDSSQAGQIAIALAAGSTSSLISTPAELIMIQQGRNQRALLTEARSYIGRHGLTALYRGFVSLFTIHCWSCCLLAKLFSIGSPNLPSVHRRPINRPSRAYLPVLKPLCMTSKTTMQFHNSL